MANCHQKPTSQLQKFMSQKGQEFERTTRKQPRPAAQGIGTTTIVNKFWLADIEMFMPSASPAGKP